MFNMSVSCAANSPEAHNARLSVVPAENVIAIPCTESVFSIYDKSLVESAIGRMTGKAKHPLKGFTYTSIRASPFAMVRKKVSHAE